MNKRLQKAKKEHENWLRKNNCHLDQIKNRKIKVVKQYISLPKIDRPNLSGIGVTGLKKPEQKYTGKETIGIAILHKSCMQPVRSKQNIQDIAKMRR